MPEKPQKLACSYYVEWARKYEIGNFEFTVKEWEAMLQALDEIWNRLDESDVKRKELEGKEEEEG